MAIFATAPLAWRAAMTDNPDAYVRAIEAHIHGWRSATFGWQDDPDPKVEWENRQRAIQEHAAECLRRIAAEIHAAGVGGTLPPSTDSAGWCRVCGHGNDRLGKLHLSNCPSKPAGVEAPHQQPKP